jgi:hypothetical protein
VAIAAMRAKSASVISCKLLLTAFIIPPPELPECVLRIHVFLELQGLALIDHNGDPQSAQTETNDWK